MRENSFIEKNKEKWNEFENILKTPKKDPDKLSELFIEVTDDLSYSRTFYKNRSVRVYLNGIAQQVFRSIYKNRRTNQKRFVYFWKEDLPNIVWACRKELLLAFTVFAISVVIGVVSSANDPSFVKVILGDRYVEMTKENIRSGDPMAVYKKANGVDMFLGITMNNIMVAFRTFLFGIFFAFGSIALLIYNGIMIGAFQYFFYERGLFIESSLSIWLHGTLEISSIIIAGGAGITLGRGLLFPGTYTRMQSLRVSGRRGLKLLLGIVPVLIIAATIESFATRITEAPDIAKAAVIFLSLAFVLGYFVWVPYRKSRNPKPPKFAEPKLPQTITDKIDLVEIKTNGEILKDVFSFYRKYFKYFGGISLLIGILYGIFGVFVTHYNLRFHFIYGVDNPIIWIRNAFIFVGDQKIFFNYHDCPALFIANFIFIGLAITCTNFFFRKERGVITENQWWRSKYFYSTLALSFLASLIINLLFVMMDVGVATFIALISVPFILIWNFAGQQKLMPTVFSPRALIIAFSSIVKFIGMYLILIMTSLVLLLVISSPFIWFYFEIINWNLSLSDSQMDKLLAFLITFLSISGMFFIFSMVTTGLGILFYSLKEISEAGSLSTRISNISLKNHYTNR